MFRIGTGIVVILFGLWLLIVSFGKGIGVLIPGVVVLIIGIVILLNKNEDTIEEIKHSKQKEHE